MSDFEVVPVGTLQRLAAVEAERDALRDEFERLKRTVALQEQTYLKHHGGSWGKCKYQAERDALLAALKIAVRQNEHDMLMTGEELRQCRAAIAKAEGGGNG